MADLMMISSTSICVNENFLIFMFLLLVKIGRDKCDRSLFSLLACSAYLVELFYTLQSRQQFWSGRNLCEKNFRLNFIFRYWSNFVKFVTISSR